jgi:hypothetical protein
MYTAVAQNARMEILVECPGGVAPTERTEVDDNAESS